MTKASFCPAIGIAESPRAESRGHYPRAGLCEACPNPQDGSQPRGNPAGVWIGDVLPDAAKMQALQTQLTASSASASAKPVVQSVMNNDPAAPARPHVQAAAPR